MAVGREFFPKKNRVQIEEKIAEIQVQRKVEILPVVAEQSGPYHSSHFRCSLFFTTIIPLIAYRLPFSTDDFFPTAYALIPLAVIGYGLPFFSKKLKRLFSTRAEMARAVQESAIRHFLQHGLHRPGEDRRVLLFVSLLERRVKILPNHALEESVPSEKWKAQAKEVASQIKEKSLGKGLLSGLEKIDHLLER